MTPTACLFFGAAVAFFLSATAILGGDDRIIKYAVLILLCLARRVLLLSG